MQQQMGADPETQSQTPGGAQEPCQSGGGVVGTEGVKNTTHWINKQALGPMELETTVPELAWVCTRSSTYLWLVFLWDS